MGGAERQVGGRVVTEQEASSSRGWSLCWVGGLSERAASGVGKTWRTTVLNSIGQKDDELARRVGSAVRIQHGLRLLKARVRVRTSFHLV